jgi:hypothetical protein
MSNWNVNSAIDFILKNHNKLNREAFKNQIEGKFDIKFRKEKLLEMI